MHEREKQLLCQCFDKRVLCRRGPGGFRLTPALRRS
jgi:hypothetical protein